MKQLQLLFLEDNAEDVELCLHEFNKEGYEIIYDLVESREDFLEALKTKKYHAILADYSLPGWTGMEAFEDIKKLGIDTPVILVTGSLGEELAVECIKLGITDYVLKDKISRLPFVVSRAVREKKFHDEHKRAVEMLRESEERYRITFDQATIGIANIGLDGKFLKVNKKLCDIFGYSEKELLELKFQDVTAPDDIDETLNYYDKILAGEISEFSREKQYVRKDGNIFWARLNSYLLRDNTDEPQYFISTIEDITERKKAEEEIQKVGKTAQTYLDIAGVIILAIDADQKVSLINNKGREVLGYKEDEIIGKNWFKLAVPKPDRKKTIEGFEMLMAGKVEPVEYFENLVISKCGEERLIAWHNIILKDEDGKITGTLSSGEDITERKQIQSDLEESETMLQKSQEIGRTGSFEMDLLTNDVTWSDQLYKLFGMKKDKKKLDYDKVLAIIHPDDRERAIKVSSDAVKEGKPYKLEHRVIHPDGKILDLLITGDVVRNENNEIIKIAGTTQDITERKRAEEELRLHSEIMRNMEEGVNLSRARDLTIVYSNPKFEDMFGYDSGELIGKHVSILNAPTGKNPENMAKKILETIEKKGIWKKEIENITKDGTHFWSFANVSMFDHPEYGKVFVSVQTDITERKKTEEDLKKFTHALGERVKELTCLFEIDEISKGDVEIECFLQEVVNLIPPAWQYPEETCGRIVFENKEYKTDNFKKTEWCLKADILIEHDKRGHIDVCYLEEVPEEYEGVFLEEERHLINSIANRIESFIIQKRSTETLRQSEEKYRNLFNKSPEPIVILGLDRTIIDCNEEMEKLTGLTREDIVGQVSLEMGMLYDEDFEKYVEIFALVLSGKDVEPIEIRLSLPDESIRWLEIYPSLIKDDDEPVAVQIINRDITIRKLTEEALKTSEELYSSVINTSKDGIGIIQDGFIKFANASLHDMLGYSHEELFEERQSKLFPEEIAEEMTSLGNDRESGKDVMELYETVLVTKKGGRVPVEIRAGLIEYDHKPASLGIIRDLRERISMEHTLAETLIKLQDSEKRREEFIDVAAHELRTPLTAIKTYVDMMRLGHFGEFKEDEKQHLDALKRGAQKLNDLIMEMLDASKAEVSKLKLDKKMVDIEKLFKGVVHEYLPLFEAKDQKIIFEVEKIKPVNIDPEQMKTVALNLLSNANKFTHENSNIIVTIKDEGDQILIQVQDTGIGIPEEDLPNVFERFFVSDKSLTRTGSQVGLGLAVTKAIVEQHGGTIWVESEEGVGSTFSFTIPRDIKGVKVKDK